MSAVPSPWEFVLLALAAWRVWTLLSSDTILDPVRDRVLFTRDGEPRVRWIDWVECPYCSGFWVAVAWWSAFAMTDWTLVAAAPWAVSAAVVFVEATVSRLHGE